MNILFICTANKLRSPTAQAIFADDTDLDVRSAGTDRECPQPIGVELVQWADAIFVMERQHRNAVYKRFREHVKRTPLIVLGIPDEYEYMQAELVDLLRRRVTRYLEHLAAE